MVSAPFPSGWMMMPCLYRRSVQKFEPEKGMKSENTAEWLLRTRDQVKAAKDQSPEGIIVRWIDQDDGSHARDKQLIDGRERPCLASLD